MASRIREVAAARDGPVLVVCGAAHVDGLRALLDQDGPLAPPEVEAPPAGDDRYGIALTPTSYAALDALDGYDAGQPTPGFYDQLFRDRAEGRADTAERMLTAITADLRGLGVFVSPADLIAVLATTRGLAGLRGHAQPWRTDLLDGITGALVKDDAGERHPLLARAVEVMRGDRVGRLAEGARRPPLVVELTAEMEALGLVPHPAARVEKADLTDPVGLWRSRLLHSLRLLEVPVGTLERPADIDGSTPPPSPTSSWRRCLSAPCAPAGGSCSGERWATSAPRTAWSSCASTTPTPSPSASSPATTCATSAAPAPRPTPARTCCWPSPWPRGRPTGTPGCARSRATRGAPIPS